MTAWYESVQIRRAGASVVEVVVSLAILAGFTVAILNTVGAAVLSQTVTEERSQALVLAQGLMEEILQQAYEEPFESLKFGPEPSEDIGDRSVFDDVDDYDGWSASPPQSADGTELSSFAGWTRAATVDWGDPDDLTAVDNAETGTKRITVTVMRGDDCVAQPDQCKTVLEVVMVTSQSWPQPPYD